MSWTIANMVELHTGFPMAVILIIGCIVQQREYRKKRKTK